MSEEVTMTPQQPQAAPDGGTRSNSAPEGQSKDGEFRKKPTLKPKRRVCSFCMAKTSTSNFIDYKDVARLRKYLTEKGKIVPRRQTGLCAAHQRELTNAIKRARNMSLL